MNKTRGLLLTAAVSLAMAFTFSGCGEDNTFTDKRDGKKYRHVKIGEQVWLAENLNYNASGSKCYRDNESNCQTYGRLYDWETAKKACPAGWHLPSKEEWDIMTAFIGGEATEGKKLKATSGWNENGNGTDEYGFSALPGGQGIGHSGGGFNSVGDYGYWWSASETGSNSAHGRIMYYSSESAGWINYPKSNLHSVRCLQGTGGAAGQAAETAVNRNSAKKLPKVEDIDIVAKLIGKEKAFLGMLGDDIQRMEVVFLSAKKIDKKKYEVTGKSKVKKNICDFTGIIEVQQIKEPNRENYDEGDIKGKYHFDEDKKQSGTGAFDGTFAISWIYSDDGEIIASGFENYFETVVFDGTWKSYRTGASKKACWSDDAHGCFSGINPKGGGYFFNDGQEFTPPKGWGSDGGNWTDWWK